MMSEISEIMLDMKKVSVRRCLFGPPDREKTRAHLDAQENTLQAESKRFQDMWGINPVTGIPTTGGKYECTVVDPTDTSVPNFYKRGFPSRKSRPVRAMHERSPVGYNRMVGSGRLTSAKRKLTLDNDTDNELNENNENLGLGLAECRVIDKDSMDVSREPFGLSSSAPIPMNCDSHLCSDSEFGLTRSSSTSSLPRLSPAPRIDPEITPPTRPKSPTQRSIKDYMPLKKQRCIAKALPRT